MLLGAWGQRGDGAGAAQEPPAALEHGAASRRVSFLAEAASPPPHAAPSQNRLLRGRWAQQRGGKGKEGAKSPGVKLAPGAGGSRRGCFCGAGPVSGASLPNCGGHRGEGRRRERTKVSRRANSRGRDNENHRPLIGELSNSRSRWLDEYRNAEPPHGAGREGEGKVPGERTQQREGNFRRDAAEEAGRGRQLGLSLYRMGLSPANGPGWILPRDHVWPKAASLCPKPPSRAQHASVQHPAHVCWRQGRGEPRPRPPRGLSEGPGVRQGVLGLSQAAERGTSGAALVFSADGLKLLIKF